MWKNQGSWNFFHAKLIPNSSKDYVSVVKNIDIKWLIPPLNGQKSPLFDTFVTDRESDACKTRK